MTDIELRDPDLDAATAAVVALAEHGVPVDIQELLVRGNPAIGVRPGALLAATKATITSYRRSDKRG